MEKSKISNFECPDGSIYSGECLKNRLGIEITGEGEINYPNGDSYKGSMKNGIPSGYGVYFFSKDAKDERQEIHQGLFEFGSPNGVGHHIYSRGSEYLGFFEMGKREGMGIYLNSLNDTISFGLWRSNRFIKDESDILIEKVLSKSQRFIPANFYEKYGFYIGEILSEQNNFRYGLLFFYTGKVYVGKIYDGTHKMKGNGVIFDKYANYLLDGDWYIEIDNVKLSEFFCDL